MFSGAGGLDLGFENAGFSVVWANDIDEDSCVTHRFWSNAQVFHGDIAEINYKDMPDTDLIIGGFPCQGFSLAGPRRIDDSRNKLYRYFADIVDKKQPVIFIAENVKGILTLGGGMVLEAIINEFSIKGYTVCYKLLNAANYGVPQNRERVFLIGLRNDCDLKFEFPERLVNTMTLREALYDLPMPKKEDICHAPFSSRYMSRNRRRGWDEVSYTIPAMAKQVPLHPSSPKMRKLKKDLWVFGEGETRRFSWKEAAIVQSFPKEIEFAGDLNSKYAQIGNAVPVKLAEAVGHSVIKCFIRNKALKEKLLTTPSNGVFAL